MQREWNIGVPCEKSFEELQGSGERRYCEQCQLHVHDFSQMKRAEIAGLVDGARGGRVCGQILYGIDGAMVTADGPTAKQRVRRAFLKAAASVGLLWLGLRRPLGAQEVKERRGFVSDANGAGVPNATVAVEAFHMQVAKTTTDREGRFALLTGLEGPATVRVTAAGFQPTILHAELGDSQPLGVVLRGGAPLGLVVEVTAEAEVQVSPASDAVLAAGGARGRGRFRGRRGGGCGGDGYGYGR